MSAREYRRVALERPGLIGPSPAHAQRLRIARELSRNANHVERLTTVILLSHTAPPVAALVGVKQRLKSVSLLLKVLLEFFNVYRNTQRAASRRVPRGASPES